MEKPRKAQSAFDPIFDRVVVEAETSSRRIRAKLKDQFRWCICELCWRPTEYSRTLQASKVVKRVRKGNAKVVPPTERMHAAAQKRADLLVERYERACNGDFGPDEPSQMVIKYCNIREMHGDFSVDGFRDHVERRLFYSEWAQHGDLLRPTRLPGHGDGSAKPSKLYCEAHNPRRSSDARRLYQRDRRFAAEYKVLIEQVWKQGINNAILTTWDTEDYVLAKRVAYQWLQVFKSPTRMIDNLLANGPTTQAEMARQLSVTRQAVSAVVKRRALKRATR